MEGLIRAALKYHWIMGLGIMVQFVVGSYCASIASALGMERATVKEAHKLFGVVFLYSGVIMTVVKLLMVVRGTVRQHIPSALGVIIRWHWIPVMALLFGQYATTTLNAQVAAALGLSRETVFKFHGWGGFALLVFSLWGSMAGYYVEMLRNKAAADAARLASDPSFAPNPSFGGSDAGSGGDDLPPALPSLMRSPTDGVKND